MTHDYGFFDECYRKFGEADLYQKFVELFDYFPLAALINKEIFCLHGGLSKDCFALDEIRKIDRQMEIPQDGVDISFMRIHNLVLIHKYQLHF